MFADARAAVRYAVTREGRPARPLMSTIGDKTATGGLGLTNYEGAAQAGMILNAVQRLNRLDYAIVIAGASFPTKKCSCHHACCSGYMINWDWRHAIEEINQSLSRSDVCPAPAELRSQLLIKIYGRRSLSLLTIAKVSGYESHTVGKHHRTLFNWLMGVRGTVNRAAVSGRDPAAWNEAESVLRDEGIVG